MRTALRRRYGHAGARWVRFRGILVGADRLTQVAENLKAIGARNVTTSAYRHGDPHDVISGEISASSRADAIGLMTAVLGYAPPKAVFNRGW